MKSEDRAPRTSPVLIVLIVCNFSSCVLLLGIGSEKVLNLEVNCDGVSFNRVSGIDVFVLWNVCEGPGWWCYEDEGGVHG